MNPLRIQLQFPKSTSPRYPRVLLLAKRAKEFRTSGQGKWAVNVAIFDNSIEQLSILQELLPLVKEWRGVRVTINRVPIRSLWQVNETLNCYLQSLLCRDFRAYCWKVDATYRPDEPIQGPGLKLSLTTNFEKIITAFPCRLMAPYGYNRITPHHPSGLKDQYQALAVERGTWWCPHFDLNRFVEEGMG